MLLCESNNRFKKARTAGFACMRRASTHRIFICARVIAHCRPNMERFLTIIKPGGLLYLVNPLGFSGHNEAARRGITVSSTQVRSSGKQLAEAGRLLENGTLRVVTDSTYPLSDAAAAHERAFRGNIQGKIVFIVD